MLRKIGPRETVQKAAPKGTRKNSQAKGSGQDEAPESGGSSLTPKVQPGAMPRESLRQRTEALTLLGMLCAFFVSPRRCAQDISK